MINDDHIVFSNHGSTILLRIHQDPATLSPGHAPFRDASGPQLPEAAPKRRGDRCGAGVGLHRDAPRMPNSTPRALDSGGFLEMVGEMMLQLVVLRCFLDDTS